MKLSMTPRVLATGAAIALLGACTRHKPVPYPDIHYQDSAQQYVMRVMPSDEIGSAKKISVYVQYVVQNNRTCIPLDYTLALGGIHPQPGKSGHYTASSIEDNKILVRFPVSIAKDEDYYGLGTCKWGIQQVSMTLFTDRGEIGNAFGNTEIERVRFIEYCTFKTSMCVLDRLSDDKVKAQWPSIAFEITKE